MSEPNTTPDLSGILEKVASNPAALSMLTALLGKAQEAKPAEPVSVPTTLPTLRPARDERTALLLAIKPFLSKEKQGAVDRMVRMLELTAVIRSVMAEPGGGEHV